MIRSIERALPFLLMIPAVLPLLFIDGLLYPYLAPKTLVFRGALVLATAAFLVLVLTRHEFYRERLKNRLTWIPGALLGWAYIASFLGFDFYHSFWSVFDRGDGLLTLSCIVVSFYGILLIADEKFVRRLLRIIAVTGSAVALFALIQWLQEMIGAPFLLPESNGRIGATLGNAAFLASYLGITFFVTLLVARDLTRVWAQRASIAAAAQFLAVVATATRGALIAFILAAGVALLYAAWRETGSVREWARYGLAGLCAVAFLFFVFREELVDAPIAVVSRIASISLTDATVESRLFIWREVGRESLSSPIVGFGAEHVEPLFNKVYDPTAIIEQWFDRSHNVYLDYFVQYGIVGLALFLSLLSAFLYKAYERILSHDPRVRRSGELLALLLIVYAVQNFFVFDTAMTLWLMFVLFAVFFVDDSRKSVLATVRVPEAGALIAGGVVALVVISVTVMPFYANVMLAGGYLYHVADISRAKEAILKGYGVGTYADLEYGYQLYQMYAERQVTMLTGAERVEAYGLARDILAQNHEAYPYDARTSMYLAHVIDLAPTSDLRDQELLTTAIDATIELSPKRIQPWYLRANIPIRQADALPPDDPARANLYGEGIEVLKEYAAVVPNFAEPRYVIATLYQTIGNMGEAARWADEARPLYTKTDENTARRAARYYIIAEDWENARYFLQEVVRASEPIDYKALYDLAKTMFVLGEVEDAAELVSRLQTEAPGLYETDPAFVQAFESALQ